VGLGGDSIRRSATRATALRLAAGLGLSLLSLLLALAALEAVLRARPTLLGQEFATGALSRYTTGAGGIYYPDPTLRMFFMIPDLKTVMYANGYVWHHETDALGFRNKPLHVPADIVVLGDSLVYGHGVELEHTIAANLERLSRMTVANLGRQGDCAFQEAYLLTEYVGRFKPQWVFHVFSPNDIADLYVHLSEPAMEAFIAQPVELITYPTRTDPARAMAERERKLAKRSLRKRFVEEAFIAKTYRWIAYRLQRDRPAPVAEAAPRVPAALAEAPPSLGWRYTEKAIEYMDDLARRHGARLAIVSLGYDRQHEILQDIARRHRVPFVETRPDMFEPWTRLPGDGHLSPAGTRRLAEILTAFLARSQEPVGGPSAPRESRPASGRVRAAALPPQSRGGIGGVFRDPPEEVTRSAPRSGGRDSARRRRRCPGRAGGGRGAT